MKLSSPTKPLWYAAAFCTAFLFVSSSFAQLGQRFPSERKVVPDPVTGVPLVFLTSTPNGDSKIYQTHPQWTSDGKWLIFRSNRARGEAIAVNEATGDMVQVTEGGYSGMLTIARNSMKLYVMRAVPLVGPQPEPAPGARRGGPPRDMQIVEINLEKLFADSAAGRMGPKTNYERIAGTIPAALGANDMAIDANEDRVYFRVGREEAAKHLPPGTEIASTFGPRNMGAGPTGIASMDIRTGAIKHVVSVPFQVGHLQTNPWVPGEIVFCWETGGKAPTRMWTVMADGTGLRPVYDEKEHEWLTHEAVITKDEVAAAIMGHNTIDQPGDWGISGTREYPTGLAIFNLRTKEMRIAGQTKSGSGLWHVHGSSDGRWAVGDDFNRDIYLIDRTNDEMILLSSGHKRSAQDHPHPTFSADNTRIQIQSAMLSEDGRSMNICIIPVPQHLLNRTYPERLVR